MKNRRLRVHFHGSSNRDFQKLNNNYIDIKRCNSKREISKR